MLPSVKGCRSEIVCWPSLCDHFCFSFDIRLTKDAEFTVPIVILNVCGVSYLYKGGKKKSKPVQKLCKCSDRILIWTSHFYIVTNDVSCVLTVFCYPEKKSSFFDDVFWELYIFRFYKLSFKIYISDCHIQIFEIFHVYFTIAHQLFHELWFSFFTHVAFIF